jgi:hypothetical protein
MMMKKKLLVLLITLASTMMPNLASAVVVDVGGWCSGFVEVDGCLLPD